MGRVRSIRLGPRLARAQQLGTSQSKIVSSTPPLPTAASITVRQALGLLDGRFGELTEGLSNRQYVLWLGSGISRDRVKDLPELITKVIVHVHGKAELGRPDCPYRLALLEVLGLAQLSPEELSAFDLSQPPVSWPLLATIVGRLRERYARLLNIPVSGLPADYLLWDAVDVVAVYADPKVEPDCEHICIAILILEGAVEEIVSANWDGLIERAVSELTGGAADVLRVCVTEDDFRLPKLRAQLIKLHGCAISARRDEPKYRPLIVARESQIADWPHNARWRVVREALIQLASVSRTLMIGLSAQDQNIQAVFLAGKERMTWNWPTHPPAYVFAEETLGAGQRLILQCVYRESFESNPVVVGESALFSAYAKQLLVALVLQMLCKKLEILARRSRAPQFLPAEFDAVCAGLRQARDLAAAAAEPDRLTFIRQAVQFWSAALHLFRHGQPKGDDTYESLSIVAVSQTGNSPDLVTSGLPELAVAIGLLGWGAQAGHWTISPKDRGRPDLGTLGVATSSGAQHRIFFASSTESATQLYVSGIVREDAADALLIYSTDPVVRQPRAPRGTIGRTGAPVIREVGMRVLLNEAASADHLAQRFREQALV